MASWRNTVLEELVRGEAKLTLVADPDGILSEEGMIGDLQRRGYVVLPFEDSIAFRYEYESMYHSPQSDPVQANLVVVFASSIVLGNAPYDLLKSGRQHSLGLKNIFPNLDYAVIRSLESSALDALFQAQQIHSPEPMGENATKDFTLRHVFSWAPELLKEPVDLLQTLLDRHYKDVTLPTILEERLVHLLESSRRFPGWPLEKLVGNREAFFTFLQERWPIFLDKVLGADSGQARTSMRLAGPANLPFDHHGVRVYVDNLFAEGFLQPVKHMHAEQADVWMKIGIEHSPEEDAHRRILKLIKTVDGEIPVPDARHNDWFRFARLWGELNLLIHRMAESMDFTDDFGQLQNRVDAAFSTWLGGRYAGLSTLASLSPIMLHHLTRHIAKELDGDTRRKIALIVVDGLSYEQWLAIREVLVAKQAGLTLKENAVFAWVPTLTSISRQTLFAGNPPSRFPKSIMTTQREPALWSQFWAEHGLAANEVMYMKGLGDSSFASVDNALSHPKVRVAGLVVDIVDRIMHGMQMGASGMINQVTQWANQSWLPNLIDFLLDRDFRIHLTSDHGNVEARGCGKPSEGSTADSRGDRVRLYSEPRLRERVHKLFPEAIAWDPVGLPPICLPLLAPPRMAFVPDKKRVVSHGGIAIEEVIVPWIQIESEHI